MQDVEVESIVAAVESIGFEATFLNKFEIAKSDLGTPISTRNETPRSSIRESTFAVRGMTCAACTGSIQKHISKLEGVLSICVSLLTHKAVVTHNTS